ncbi:glycosyltransferase family 2 protein [Flavobacterium glaciei]|uniref:Glycosyltransferase involved in cell wall biosynthesis n=1 Tax=Flavobacterium glaciei TaxID=386300 RepID=A0A562Q5Y8_9FLAO|nr:glycosyltransferase family 2 protein [Flavobacterium glaciei]RDI58343.1 glycosyltransferase involved in cell wall biosynthesis [Flavobacterium glaciei]TWI52128.1 glycosyltransferase involved in cell wall biosynthesis [Flavobacterium glaciei]
MKKLSIITINYNNFLGLQKTVESVLNQTWQEFEFIVIDGGSTDESAAYLESLSDKITYWVSEPDKGIYNAMNKGIAKATGEYLLFLNSGDHFMNTLSLQEVQKHLFKEDVIYFNINVIDKERSYILENPAVFSFLYLHNNLPCHQCTFIHQSVFERVGYYDESLKIVADWKLLLQAILKHNVTYRKVDAVFSIFYKDGISSLPENQSIMEAERSQVLEAEFPVLLNDLNEYFVQQRIIRNLQKSRKINWLIKLGFLDKF